jgi:hypothetical protein
MAAFDGGTFGLAAPGAQLQYEDEQSEWTEELPYDGQSIDFSLPMDGQSIDTSLPAYSSGGGYDGAGGSGGGPSSSPGEGFGTGDLYSLATNNVLGAGLSLAENTNAISTAASLGGQSPLGAALAPLGVYSGVQSVNEAWDRPLAENDYLGSGLQKGGDLLANSAGLASSMVGTTGLMGAGLTAAGATGTGGLLTSTAASLGPAGAVLAAGAGGYAAGNWLAENTPAGEASVGLVGGIDSLLTGEGERSALLRASEWLEDTF